ncbi:DNA-(apurinic or apyrimidinic site) endonuclease 2-like isoform X1 [Ptychodera flava]|uniref:DNA-(apurinic or apyrimidinic site) endonuclease 2-like isoform X1 n=1 Tax=Ptychodera flava TaxID=63121 RepID=UPI003969F6EF
MKILSWNINGLRACKTKLEKLFESLDADIICLQETKITHGQLDEASAIVDGYNSYFSLSRGKQGYSGVATFCRDSASPIAAEEGLTGRHASSAGKEKVGCYGDLTDFTDEELQSLDNEGRCVITVHKIKDSSGNEREVAVMNVYCPRYDSEDEKRLRFKLDFYKLLQKRSEALLKAGKHVIILGDVNQSHKPIDHCEPDDKRYFEAKPGRYWLSQFLCELTEDGRPIIEKRDCPGTSESESDSPEKGSGKEKSGGLFIDTFRYFHPQQTEAFTFWSTQTSARQLNYGTRIDYIIADIPLCEEIFEDSMTMPDFQGSDHCPVKATLNCTIIAAKRCPSLCTKYMPEFAGKQQKLSAFFLPMSKKPATQEKAASSQSHVPPEDKRTKETKLPVEKESSSGAGKQPLKRNSSNVKGGPVKKQKTTTDGKTKHAGKIFSFFQRKESTPKVAKPEGKYEDRQSCEPSEKGLSEDSIEKVCPANNTSSTSNDECSTSQNLDNSSGASRLSQSSAEECEERKKSQAAQWKNVLRGPRPPPLCKGHQEPAVLRTVKKSGPNYGKQFYTCARPEGRKTDKEARCDYFIWVKKR